MKIKYYVVAALLAGSSLAIADEMPADYEAPGEAAPVVRPVTEPEAETSIWDDLEISASLAGTSDYIWRGISQTRNRPAIQGSFDIDYTFGDLGFFKENSIYGGVWGSNVSFAEVGGAFKNTSMEIDLYVGFTGNLGETNVSWDAGWLRYVFPGSTQLDNNEMYFGLTYEPVDWFAVSGYGYWGLEVENGTAGDYYDLATDVKPLFWLDSEAGPVTAWFSKVNLGAHLGRYEKTDGSTSYWDWKVSVDNDLLGINWEVAYTETDLGTRQQVAEQAAHVVFTVSKSF